MTDETNILKAKKKKSNVTIVNRIFIRMELKWTQKWLHKKKQQQPNRIERAELKAGWIIHLAINLIDRVCECVSVDTIAKCFKERQRSSKQISPLDKWRTAIEPTIHYKTLHTYGMCVCVCVDMTEYYF